MRPILRFLKSETNQLMILTLLFALSQAKYYFHPELGDAGQDCLI